MSCIGSCTCTYVVCQETGIYIGWGWLPKKKIRRVFFKKNEDFKLEDCTKHMHTCLRNLDLLADSRLDCFLLCLFSSRSSCQSKSYKLVNIIDHKIKLCNILESIRKSSLLKVLCLTRKKKGSTLSYVRQTCILHRNSEWLDTRTSRQLIYLPEID